MATGRLPPPPPIRTGVQLPQRVAQSQLGAVNPHAFGAVGRAPPPRPQILNPGPAVPQQRTGDRQVDEMQRQNRAANAYARADPQGGLVVLEGTLLSSGLNVVSHGLGRAFRGCYLATPSVAITYSVQRPSGIAADRQTVSVTASAGVLCDLVVW